MLSQPSSVVPETQPTQTSPLTITIGTASTPVGEFHAVFTQHGLARLSFPLEKPEVAEAWVERRMPGAHRSLDRLKLIQLGEQLTVYFEGSLRSFSVPLDLFGTPFQLEVWQALTEIEYGEVRTYSDVARSIGRPRAVRAVGAANGANPVAIIVPCHRVIGRDGTLTGYGGGLDVKLTLLQREGAVLF